MPVETRSVPFRDLETWVQVTTPESPVEGALPLVVLHGGPGMAHDYLKNLGALADETGRTVVHYDQVGNGHAELFEGLAPFLPIEKIGGRRFFALNATVGSGLRDGDDAAIVPVRQRP